MPNTAHCLNVCEGLRDELCETAPSEEGWQAPAPLRAIPWNRAASVGTTAFEIHLVERLFFLLSEETPRVVVFCGADAKDGSELICAKAAEVLADEVKDSICLIDADLRTPTLHRRYRTDDPYRSAEQEPSNEAENSKHAPWPNLWVVPATQLKAARLGFPLDHFRNWVKRLRERFSYILICAPPLETAPEVFLWGRVADGVVVTLLANSTKRETAMKVRVSLDRYNVRLLGFVLNTARRAKPY
jgi:Mrp family chromosome partitioning ATPase